MAAPQKGSKLVAGLILTPAVGICGYFGYSYLDKKFQKPKQYQVLEQKKKQISSISENLHFLKGKKKDIYVYGVEKLNADSLSDIQKAMRVLQPRMVINDVVDQPEIYRKLAKLRMQNEYPDIVSKLRNTLLNEPAKLYKEPVAGLNFSESLILLLNDEVETRRILILRTESDPDKEEEFPPKVIAQGRQKIRDMTMNYEGKYEKCLWMKQNARSVRNSRWRLEDVYAERISEDVLYTIRKKGGRGVTLLLMDADFVSAFKDRWSIEQREYEAQTIASRVPTSLFFENCISKKPMREK